MFKLLLSTAFFIIPYFILCQTSLIKIDELSKSKIIVNSDGLMGRSVSNVYWTLGSDDYNSDDLNIQFTEDVIGIVITGIGQMSEDTTVAFLPVRFSLLAEDADGADIAPLIAAENNEDGVIWNSEINELKVEKSTSSPLHIFFNSRVREITLSKQSGNSNIQFIKIEGFYEGSKLFDELPDEPLQIECDSLHTTFVVDVSHSIDENDLTYISNQIFEWIQEKQSDETFSNQQLSLIAFAGRSEMVLPKTSVQNVTFNAVFNSLKNVQPTLEPHTNWIKALETAKENLSHQIIFISDGWHNGNEALHDSITNDVEKIQTLAGELRSQANVFAIGIDGLAAKSNSVVLKLICGENITGAPHMLVDSAGSNWWIAIDEAFNQCQTFDFNLVVNKTGNNVLDLEWKALDNISEYYIYRKLTDGPWEQMTDLKYIRTAQGYRTSDTHLDAGVYTYQVRADIDRRMIQTNEGKGEITGILSCYPNPADNFIVVNLKIKDPKAENIHITDLLGHNYQLNIDQGEKNRWRIDTQTLHPGSYIITYHDGISGYKHKIKFVIL